MNWADKRRLIILGIFCSFVLLVVLGTAFAILYKAPSCMDNKQDQNEEGVDCGGVCTYLCNASVSPPTVTFTRPVSPSPGRIDVISYISNPNARAAVHNAAYTIEVYDADNVLIGTQKGMIDLPPASTVPVFVPNFFSGDKVPAHTFLSFDDSSIKWFTYTGTRVIPVVGNVTVENTATPHAETMLTNPTAFPLYNVTAVATVFDAEGNAIAASQTVLPQIPPQGSEQAIFTWNLPFTAVPVKVDVIPVVPLDKTP